MVLLIGVEGVVCLDYAGWKWRWYKMENAGVLVASLMISVHESVSGPGS